MTKLILFGSEIVGKDALHFFGNNNVECSVIIIQIILEKKLKRKR